MRKSNFTRKEVVGVIEDLLQKPDLLRDAPGNEDSNYIAEDLLNIGVQILDKPFN